MDDYVIVKIHESAALIKKKRYEEAERLLNDILYVSRNNTIALNNLGVVYAKTKRRKRALELFDRALELNPSLKVARKNRRFYSNGLYYANRIGYVVGPLLIVVVVILLITKNHNSTYSNKSFTFQDNNTHNTQNKKPINTVTESNKKQNNSPVDNNAPSQTNTPKPTSTNKFIGNFLTTDSYPNGLNNYLTAIANSFFDLKYLNSGGITSNYYKEHFYKNKDGNELLLSTDGFVFSFTPQNVTFGNLDNLENGTNWSFYVKIISAPGNFSPNLDNVEYLNHKFGIAVLNLFFSSDQKAFYFIKDILYNKEFNTYGKDISITFNNDKGSSITLTLPITLYQKQDFDILQNQIQSKDFLIWFSDFFKN